MLQESSRKIETPVVVTGLGAFTAAGRGASALWEATVRGHSLARTYRPNNRKSGSALGVCSAPEVEFAYPELNRLRKMDRGVQMAGAAAAEAWHDAGFGAAPPEPDRGPVFCGTSRGPLGVILESQARWNESGKIRPSVALNSTIACLSGALSHAFGLGGPCLTISAACASSAAAIALAAQQIRSGMADFALAGGAEAPLQDIVIAQLESAGVLSSHPEPHLACRPFDAARNGTVLGEGAAFLILESLDHARRRGARIYAQFSGWSVNSEYAQRTGISDNTEGLQRTMRAAVTMAGLTFDDLDYINAHGTGTALNDRSESYAIAACGGRGGRLRTSSTKAVTGHCMGAASAIEAVLSVLALERQCLPPSANCFEQASDCPVQLVTGKAQPSVVHAVLSNSLGFWGNNASLVFTSPSSR